MPRRIRGPGVGTLLGRLQSLVGNLPYLSWLSPLDRMLVLVGASLLIVVSFSYLFLVSDIFSSSGSLSPLLGGSSDPRLSSELRRTGLSEEALLRRGGGRRIFVGPKQLDANENAAALDIISALNCDALQEEIDRHWHTVLDGKQLEAEKAQIWEEEGWGRDNGAMASEYEGGMADDFAGELAGEVVDGNGSHDRWPLGDVGSGDGNVGLDDLVNKRRLLDFHDDLGMDDHAEFNSIGSGDSSESANHGLKLTARHLFCLAAEAITLPKPISENDKGPATHCDVNSFDVRDELLYLWSSARSQMSEEVIQKTLRLVLEHEENLRGHEVHIWYPDGDQGTQGMLRVLNSGYEGKQTYNFDSEPADSGHDDLYRFHDLPSKFVGPNKLFVDVGSALGLTSMLITYLYPGTTVVSIEPASPSWLIQNINFRCNLSHNQLQYIHPILAGVGTRHHDDNDSMMPMVWRPSMTTATRNWTPKKDFDFAADIELMVHLRTLRAILAEATPEDLPLGTPISILNLDCEGCEYNLIPSMHETSFNSIGVVLGRTNWGYIPLIKKPSSETGRKTHMRLCTHYNFAKRCKECCDFPSLLVKPRQSDANNELKEKTLAEVAGELCNGFEEWAIEQRLREIPDDYGWNEMSSFAASN